LALREVDFDDSLLGFASKKNIFKSKRKDFDLFGPDGQIFFGGHLRDFNFDSGF
jgi:hypothetical protein